eukprot:TRINITY_DN48841_c0_g1_i1.p1 TRINITY_DN48841_c0_g1~~TRINITY_DN48841_c0_g1_i1.p1  ORF type:complete len:118 (-),score=14.52 TRINITY_DN48841_c0_g1_i1:286-639(-)
MTQEAQLEQVLKRISDQLLGPPSLQENVEAMKTVVRTRCCSTTRTDSGTVAKQQSCDNNNIFQSSCISAGALTSLLDILGGQSEQLEKLWLESSESLESLVSLRRAISMAGGKTSSE